MSRDSDDINSKMARIAPELSSKYAAYPLNNSRWLFPQEKLADNEAGFVSAYGNPGVKPNYVYGRTEELGPGYYHLLTRTSYQILFNRLRSEAHGEGCCSCDKETRKKLDDYDTVKRIVYNRSIASVSS